MRNILMIGLMMLVSLASFEMASQGESPPEIVAFTTENPRDVLSQMDQIQIVDYDETYNIENQEKPDRYGSDNQTIIAVDGLTQENYDRNRPEPAWKISTFKHFNLNKNYVDVASLLPENPDAIRPEPAWRLVDVQKTTKNEKSLI